MTRATISPHALIHEMSRVERSQAMVSACSCYAANEWDFSNEFPKLPRSELRVKFDLALASGSLTDGAHAELLDSLKCLIYSLVFDPPQFRLGISTIIRAVRPGHGLAHLYVFLANNNFRSLAAITKDDFDDFLEWVCELPGQAEVITDRTLKSRVHGIEWIPLQGKSLFDRFQFAPWEDARSVGRWARSNAEIIVARGELRTQPWSDSLIEAMVRAALAELEMAPEIEKCCVDYVENRESRQLMRRKYVALRSAVGLLVMLFTGMRLTEALQVPSDLKKSVSIVEIRDGDRSIRGRFVHSTQSKKTMQIEDSWITIQIVHEAITVLAKVDERVPVKYSYLLHAMRLFGLERDTQRRLAARVFMEGLNNLATKHRVDLSEVGGRICSFDFRRTFARLLTRKGLHVLELKYQLKHAEADLAMQYGAPGLKEYLIVEKQNFTRDQYNELLAGDEEVIGGGAAELKEMRIVFRGLTRGEKEDFLRTLPNDALIDQTDLGLCRYRPHLALCGGNKVACKPDACKNSVIQVDEFRKTVDFRASENARMAKIFARHPAKRAHLKAQLVLLDNLRRQMEES